jgi:hypothetical protein
MFEEHKHAEPGSADGLDSRKVQNYGRISSRHDEVAELEHRIALNNPAFTFENCQIRQIVNADR